MRREKLQSDFTALTQHREDSYDLNVESNIFNWLLMAALEDCYSCFHDHLKADAVTEVISSEAEFNYLAVACPFVCIAVQSRVAVQWSDSNQWPYSVAGQPVWMTHFIKFANILLFKTFISYGRLYGWTVNTF